MKGIKLGLWFVKRYDGGLSASFGNPGDGACIGDFYSASMRILLLSINDKSWGTAAPHFSPF
jgi:hypothetical protein